MFLWLIVVPFVLITLSSLVYGYIEKQNQERIAEDLRIADRGLQLAMTPEQFREYKASEARDKKQKADNAKAEKDLKDAREMAILLAESDVKKVLRDPDSAKFGQRVVRANGKAELGITICGYVNSRNGFGAYTGDKGYIVIDRYPQVEDGTEYFAAQWKHQCI